MQRRIVQEAKEMSFYIEYCSPLKPFQHSVSLFLSTIIIGEGKVEEGKKKKEGIILRERDELKVPFAMAKSKTDFRIFLR